VAVRPFDPRLLPEGHPDKIAVPARGTVLDGLWRGLVRYCLWPSYRGLVALGSTHVAALWHPEFGAHLQDVSSASPERAGRLTAPSHFPIPRRTVMSDARLVGTWTTHLDDDGKAVPGLVSFSADGSVVSTQLNTKNIGLGTWRVTGSGTFEYGFHILAADPEGKHVGEAHVRVSGEFVSDTEWQGTGGAEFFDPQGTKLRGHAGSKVTAGKFGIDD
jgi:hypothetical protein